MNQRIRTNTTLDGEITGASPDAQYDLFNLDDYKKDFDYLTSKYLDIFGGLANTNLTDLILIQNGGLVTDSGSSQVDISAVYAIGLAVDGAIRPVYIPALTNVSLPSGWNDGRPIWVIAKHEYIVTGALRNHLTFPAQQYHNEMIDSYYGHANTDLLFTDSAPAAGTVILGKFTMTGSTFANLSVRSSELILKNINIDTLKLVTSGVSKSFIKNDSDGSIILYVNCYLDPDNSTVRLATTGKRARRLRLEGSDGYSYWDYSQIGNAGDIASWTSAPSLEIGKIQGNLEFQSTSTPPTIKTGIREFLGIYHRLITDKNLALTDVLGGCSQTFSDHTYTWQRVIIDASGNYHWVPACDTQATVGSLLNISVSGIVIAAGTATVSTANTTGLVAGNMAVIKGATIGGNPLILIGKVVSVTAGVSFTMKTSASGTVAGTITYSAYYRIYTSQGGTPAGINTDTDVTKYTPSPQYCDELLGYYLDQYGLPTTVAANVVYRILGVFEINGSGNVTTDIYSYKSGAIKNDNECILDGATSYGVVNTVIPIFPTLTRARGNDYNYSTSANAGNSFTFMKELKPKFKAYFQNSINTQRCGFTKNSAQLTTNVENVTDDQTYLWNTSLTTIQNNCAYDGHVNNSDIIRCHTNGAVGLGNIRLRMSIEE